MLRHVTPIHHTDGLDFAEEHDVDDADVLPSDEACLPLIVIELGENDVEELSQVLVYPTVVYLAFLVEDFRVCDCADELASQATDRAGEVAHDFIDFLCLCLVEKMGAHFITCVY